MVIRHDSRNEAYRLPVGAMPAGGRVLLKIEAPEAEEATLRIWWNEREIRHPMKKGEDGFFSHTLKIPEETGTLWYYFMLEMRDGCVYYGNARDNLGGEGTVYGWEPPSFQITVYDSEKMKTPDWMKDGVMYQIMPDRFASSGVERKLPAGAWKHENWYDVPSNEESANGDSAARDFFGGDFKGAQEKLDYLKELGISVIYFNPVFQSASNHRYNTGDYRKIDPMLGSEADFADFCAAAHERGIRVILDGVFSHTGSDSAYFNRSGNYGRGGAYRSKKSKYSSWYTFKNWPDEYECWWGFDTLPNVNEMDPAYLDFITGEGGIVEKWLRAGADGWRLDVADELPMEFIRAIRSRVKSVKPDAALIGEVWEDPTNKIAYNVLRNYCLGDTLDCVMNYPVREAVIGFMTGALDGRSFVRRVSSLMENMPREAFYAQMNLLGSHDRARIISMLSGAGNMEPDRAMRYHVHHSPEEYARGKRRFLAAWETISALPGMPSLYYGDEAGMTGMSDPFNRGTYPWGREDAELVEAIRGINCRRRENKLLRRGGLELSSPDGNVILITRKLGDERATLAVNRGAAEYRHEGTSIPAESAVWIK